MFWSLMATFTLQNGYMTRELKSMSQIAFLYRIANAAVKEFEGILDDLYNKPPKWDLVTIHRDELQNYREIIKYQDKKLREITERY